MKSLAKFMIGMVLLSTALFVFTIATNNPPTELYAQGIGGGGGTTSTTAVRTSISATSGVAYNSGTGVITLSSSIAPTNATVTTLTAGTTLLGTTTVQGNLTGTGIATITGTLTTTGRVGIGTSSPLYKFDTRTTETNTPFHVSHSSGSDDGYYITPFDGFTVITSGSAWNGSSYVAKNAVASHYANGSTPSWYINTGLTPGNTFTPTERMRLTSSGWLGISTAGVNSVLTVNGPIATAYSEKSASYLLTASDSIITITSGTITLTLPAATSITGRTYTLLNEGAGVVTLTSASGITGTTSIPAGSSTNIKRVDATSNGTGWKIY